MTRPIRAGTLHHTVEVLERDIDNLAERIRERLKLLPGSDVRQDQAAAWKETAIRLNAAAVCLVTAREVMPRKGEL